MGERVTVEEGECERKSERKEKCERRKEKNSPETRWVAYQKDL